MLLAARVESGEQPVGGVGIHPRWLAAVIDAAGVVPNLSLVGVEGVDA